MKFNNKVLEVWAKWVIGMTASSIATIGKFPLDLTASDWKHVANALWVALLPIIIKWWKEEDFNFTTPKKQSLEAF